MMIKHFQKVSYKHFWRINKQKFNEAKRLSKKTNWNHKNSKRVKLSHFTVFLPKARTHNCLPSHKKILHLSNEIKTTQEPRALRSNWPEKSFTNGHNISWQDRANGTQITKRNKAEQTQTRNILNEKHWRASSFFSQLFFQFF